MSSLNTLLAEGLTQLNLNLSTDIQEKWLCYLQILAKWNKAYNLTAVTELNDMVVRHILDCAATLPYLPTNSPLLDVGSGAGLPGLIYAIARPEQQFYLLDSLGKRTIFLEKVVRDLALTNVQIINKRVQDYHPAFSFAIISSRAFSSLKLFVDSTKQLANENTVYFALKGKPQPEELAEIESDIKNLVIHEIKVPQLDAQRQIVCFELNI